MAIYARIDERIPVPLKETDEIAQAVAESLGIYKPAQDHWFHKRILQAADLSPESEASQLLQHAEREARQEKMSRIVCAIPQSTKPHLQKIVEFLSRNQFVLCLYNQPLLPMFAYKVLTTDTCITQ